MGDILTIAMLPCKIQCHFFDNDNTRIFLDNIYIVAITERNILCLIGYHNSVKFKK